MPLRRLLVIHSVYLVYTLHAYVYVLPLIGHVHDVIERSAQLTYHPLYGQHHAQGEAAVYHCRGRDDDDDDAGELVDADASGLLGLAQRQRPSAYAEYAVLYLPPLLALALLASLLLYLGHATYHLIDSVLLIGLLLKILVVQHLAPPQKEHDP